MIPNCPVHGTPMRASNHGAGFFCSKKAPTQSGYCDQKAAGVAPDAPVPYTPENAPRYVAPGIQQNPFAQPTSPQPANSTDGRYHLAAAALTAASWVYGQIDPTLHPQITEAARRFYREMEALVKS